jgi:hypothetical protein
MGDNESVGGVASVGGQRRQEKNIYGCTFFEF